jgi:hypothetical protein
MEALMTGTVATEVEYQVQKWMGSLFSVGMSDTAVSTISTALGQIASGQIDGLTGSSGAGNLLVMAANEAGLSIAEILAEGLNAEKTNQLLQATVNYLAEIAKSSEGNNVVQQQLANVFGVKASDLRAATNLAVAKDDAKYSIDDIFNESLNYGNMLNQLFSMADSMASRTSIGEMMSNVWANGQYTLAGGMASNPISYLVYKAATLLDNAVGGITFGLPLVMGNGLPIELKVSDLMRVGAMGTGILGSIGAMVQGLGNSFSGQAMLGQLGIDSGSNLKITPRGGSKDGISAPDETGKPNYNNTDTSSSGYVGNAADSDIKNSTMQAAEDDAKKQMVEAQEEAPANQVDMINNTVLKIYELLDNVAKGNQTLRVRVDNYGLTGTNQDA